MMEINLRSNFGSPISEPWYKEKEINKSTT